MGRSKRFKRFLKHKELFFLSLPAVVFVFIFSYIPMYGLILPFKDYKYNLGFWKSPWVGFENFKFLFNSDNAIRITRNTLLLNATFIIALLIVSLAIAIMLNELARKTVKVLQTAMFFPYFLSWVVVGYVFLGMFDMNHGMLNNILKIFGQDPVLWYNDPKYWPVILPITYVWKNAGYYAIIYFAGILGIDKELYEAAKLDGASKLQQIRRITLPLLTPLISIMVLLQIGKIFTGNFDMIFNVTRNSALLYPTTDVVDTFVYRSLKTMGDIGMSSAAGIYQSVVGFVLVLGTNKIIKKINPENALF
ncbi:MAG: ABC transporter permease subunit [Firmicutes bacterium]|nr:ABC transporter permease subunit [Bacillota bacterium]